MRSSAASKASCRRRSTGARSAYRRRNARLPRAPCQHAKAMQPTLRRADHAPADLVALHRLEQRLEVAFTEAFVPLALDEFEEHRHELRLGEDLQQQAPVVAFDFAVHQDPPLLQ